MVSNFVVSSGIFAWHFFELSQGWINFAANYVVLHFHDSFGVILGAALDTPGILKPAIAGLVANCRLADVRLVLLEMNLPLGHISTNALTRSLSAQFYIPLPQTTVVVADGNQNDRNLTTLHVNADIGLCRPVRSSPKFWTLDLLMSHAASRALLGFPPTLSWMKLDCMPTSRSFCIRQLGRQSTKIFLNICVLITGITRQLPSITCLKRRRTHKATRNA